MNVADDTDPGVAPVVDLRRKTAMGGLDAVAAGADALCARGAVAGLGRYLDCKQPVADEVVALEDDIGGVLVNTVGLRGHAAVKNLVEPATLDHAVVGLHRELDTVANVESC